MKIRITLPTHLHKDHTIAALNAGKHIFLEKPSSGDGFENEVPYFVDCVRQGCTPNRGNC